MPPLNNIDVLVNDTGFIAIINKKGGLAGFNMAARGGMDVIHKNKKTHPNCQCAWILHGGAGQSMAKKIILTQQDHSNYGVCFKADGSP